MYERFYMFLRRFILCSLCLPAFKIAASDGWDQSDKDLLYAINEGVAEISGNTANYDGESIGLIQSDVENISAVLGQATGTGYSLRTVVNYLYDGQQDIESRIIQLRELIGTDHDDQNDYSMLGRLVLIANYLDKGLGAPTSQYNSFLPGYQNHPVMDAINAIYRISRYPLIVTEDGSSVAPTALGVLQGWGGDFQISYTNGIYGKVGQLVKKADAQISHLSNIEYLITNLTRMIAINSTNLLLTISPLSLGDGYPDSEAWYHEQIVGGIPGNIDGLPYYYNLPYSIYLTKILTLPYHTMRQNHDSFYDTLYQSQFAPDESDELWSGMGDTYYKYYGNWPFTNLVNNISNIFNRGTNVWQQDVMSEEDEEEVVEDFGEPEPAMSEEDLSILLTNTQNIAYEDFLNTTNETAWMYISEDLKTNLNFNGQLPAYSEGIGKLFSNSRSSLTYSFGVFNVNVEPKDLLEPVSEKLESSVKPKINLVLQYACYLCRFLCIVTLLRKSFQAVSEVMR